MRELSLAMLLGAASALRAPVHSTDALSRRHLIQCTPVVAGCLAAEGLPLAAVARPTPPPSLDNLKVLTAKARGLRGYVRSTAANRRLFPFEEGGDNYINVANYVKNGQKTILLPLQAALIAAAAATTLPDEERQKQLLLQPELLKGHFSELDFYLKKRGFDEYTSKTTGDVYPGGKVERELEEVCDTAADFLLLVQNKPAPVRDD